MNIVSDIIEDFTKLHNPTKAKHLQKFFKTGKNEYAEGDIFLGLTVPQTRSFLNKYQNLELVHISTLLNSKYHEIRLFALLSLVNNYLNITKNKLILDIKKYENHKEIFEFYLRNIKHINNWDLVDLSARQIVGDFILNNKNESEQKDFLLKMAGEEFVFVSNKNSKLWEKRIAVLSTFQFLFNKIPFPTIYVSEKLLNDKHDLIHKSTGWMLREMGKKCGQEILIDFLRKYYKKMPRTMLRYAIEKFPEEERKNWLKK